MIFPSVFANVEPGIASQLSVYAVITFSFLINNFKKIFIFLLLVISFVFAVITSDVFAGIAPLSPYNAQGPGMSLTLTSIPYKSLISFNDSVK